MNGLLLIDAAASLAFLAGFHLAFRRKAVRRWLAAIQARSSVEHRSCEQGPALRSGDDEAAPVFLMLGVMIMAFAFTAAAFANLIAYYSAHSPN